LIKGAVLKINKKWMDARLSQGHKRT